MKFFLTLVFLISCEPEELRSAKNRPTQEGDDVPGYIASESKKSAVGEAIRISLENTVVEVGSGATNQASVVRMRILETAPENSKTADLEPKGDVVEISFLDASEQLILGSEILDSPFLVSQQLSGITSESDLKYIAVVDPGTENEKISVLGSSAFFDKSLSLLDLSGLVTVSIKLTHIVLYAVEVSADAIKISVSDSSESITGIDSGDTNSSGEQQYTARSDGVNGDAQSSIDCSQLIGGVWVAVPKNPEVGQNEDFCVMKYEAHSDDTNVAESTTEFESSLKLASDATENCNVLGDGFTLLTNEMWQTIARNIETAQFEPGKFKNWSNNSPDGNNKINIGASIVGRPEDDDTRACFSEANGVFSARKCINDWELEKRTHELSNGSIIWDFSGGKAEAMKGIETSVDGNGPRTSVALGIESLDWTNLMFGPTFSYAENGEFPKSSTNSFGGLGFLNTSGVTGGLPVIRGSGDEDYIGIFTTSFVQNPQMDKNGFRCAYNPICTQSIIDLHVTASNKEVCKQKTTIH